jgi:hypothetical protein
VFDPSTDTLYHAIKGNGAYKNGSPWEIKHTNDHLTYVTDRKLKDTPHAAKIESLLHENVEKLSLNGVKEMAGAGSVLNGYPCTGKWPRMYVKVSEKRKRWREHMGLCGYGLYLSGIRLARNEF